MYISNSSSGMATLLQQKNCMKTLTNGGNVVSGSSAGGSAHSSVGSSLNGGGGGGSTNTVVVTNGAVVGAATGNISSGGGDGVGINSIHHQGQQAATRLLMPHVSIPIGSIISTGNIGHGTSNTQGAFLVAGYPQQQQQQQQQQQTLTSESLNSYLHNSNSNLITTSGAASMFSHNDNHQTVVSNTAAPPSSSTPGAGQTTRYFSQFSNQSATSANLPSSASSLISTAAAAGPLTNFNHRITNNFNQHFRNGGGSLLQNRVTQQQQHSHQIHHNVTIIKTEQSEPPTTNTTTTTTTFAAAASAKSIATSRHRYGTSTLQQIKTEAEAAAKANKNTDNEDKIDVVLQKFPLNGVPKGAGNSIKEEPIFTDATEETNAAAATSADVIVAGEDEAEPEPEIDIVINNVVCSFSVRCHLNLREIALNGFNVEFRRENGMVTMKLRRPYTTASIWSSGRITCTGATSEDQAKIAARRYARCLQKLGFRVRFNNFRVVNVLGTCSMPWAIKIVNFSERYKKEASYEPELHPGVTYKLRFPKATLKIFSTGSITVTAASVANVQAAIEHIFPLVYEFRKKRTPEEMEALRLKQQLQHQQQQQQQQQQHGRTYLETADLNNEDIIIDLVHSPPRSSIASAAASNKQVTILSASSSLSPSSSSSKLLLTAKNKRKRKLIDAGEVKDCDDPDDPDDPDDVSRMLGDRELIGINTADEDGDDDDLIMNSTRDGGCRSGGNTRGVFMVTEYDDPDDLIEGPDEVDDDIDDDDDL